MDVEQATFVATHEVVGQDAHEAGEYNEVGKYESMVLSTSRRTHSRLSKRA